MVGGVDLAGQQGDPVAQVLVVFEAGGERGEGEIGHGGGLASTVCLYSTFYSPSDPATSVSGCFYRGFVADGSQETALSSGAGTQSNW